MREAIAVAIIAAVPGCLAAVLAFLSNRSLKRSVGTPTSIPLTRVVEGLADRIDKLLEGQADIRERLARLEGGREPIWSQGGGSP